MAEYEPVTNRQDFLQKWLAINRSKVPITVDHLSQLALDIFATRRSERWRDCDRFLDDQQGLFHPDGRVIYVTFDERVGYPLSPYVTYFPNEEAADDYEYEKEYEFRRRAEGSIVVIEDPGDGENQVITLDPPSCYRLFKELLQAHLNTPFLKNPALKLP